MNDNNKKWQQEKRSIKIEEKIRLLTAYQPILGAILAISIGLFIFLGYLDLSKLGLWYIWLLCGLLVVALVGYIVVAFFQVRIFFLVIVSLGIAYLLFELDRRGIYVLKDNKDNILSEFFGLLFDILLFGIIIVFYDKIIQKSHLIEGYLEDIEDLKSWKSEESKYRIIGRLKRLKKYKKSPISVSNGNFSNVDITGVFLESSDLAKCDFSSSNISEVKFTNSKLEKSNFSNSQGVRTDFTKSNLWLCEFKGSKFSFAKFRSCILRSAECSSAVFEDCLFAGIVAQYTKFVNSNLQRATFFRSTLEKFDFSGANLREANFERVSLRSVIFNSADLRGTKFKYIGLSENIDLENAKVSSPNWLNELISNLDKKTAETTINYINSNYIISQKEMLDESGTFYLIERKNEMQ